MSHFISIHALREEGDSPTPGTPPGQFEFLSTPSARRATTLVRSSVNLIVISIHALREEGDYQVLADYTGKSVFLSTPSARRATVFSSRISHSQSISIHALREEGDPGDSCRVCPARYFYPRPPRGGRLSSASNKGSPPIFLSTPSARRATNSAGLFCLCQCISIHALREEGDSPGQAPALRLL